MNQNQFNERDNSAPCHYINGQWVLGNGPTFYSYDPTTGAPIWEGREATEWLITESFQGAQLALKTWSALSVAERIAYLQRFAETVEANRDKLAQTISIETGKPLWESLTEVASVIGKIPLSIKAYTERNPQISTQSPDATAIVRYKPQGVVVVLGAYNFPAHLSNGHIVPALLAGNTVILKPSELTPLTSVRILQYWHDAGLPAGVMQCLQGGSGVGRQLIEQDIAGVFFTGSHQTGVRINQQLATRPEVIVALEMGGNNPLIIDTPSDMNAAIYNTLLSTLITTGQRCTCARRLFIPDNAFGDKFLTHFIKTINHCIIGMYNDNPTPFMGPVIGYLQAQNAIAQQTQLINNGGQALMLMSHLKDNTGFVSPGIIDMSKSKLAYDEEIFGPLVQVYRYNHFDEAITLANQTRFGLAAGLLGDDLTRYQHFYAHIRAGLVNWNRPTTGAVGSLPFGGVGFSGNHRPSGFYASDYCSYPIASLEQPNLTLPEKLLPGIQISEL